MTGSLQKTEGSSRFTIFLCEVLLRLYDVTHDLKYVKAVRRQATFVYRYVRAPQAEDLLRQAADSDPQDVEARFRLWRVLTREKKTSEANVVSAELNVFAQTSNLADRLRAIGWKQP